MFLSFFLSLFLPLPFRAEFTASGDIIELVSMLGLGFL